MELVSNKIRKFGSSQPHAIRHQMLVKKASYSKSKEQKKSLISKIKKLEESIKQNSFQKVARKADKVNEFSGYKPIPSSSLKYIVGTCALKCPEEETVRRYAENNIHLLEKDLKSYPLALAPLKDLKPVDRTVKALTRSSAGLIINKPHLVRNEATLWESLQYLWKYLLDIDSFQVDDRFTTVFIFGFISDRTRSIRKDFNLQGYLVEGGLLSKICIEAFEEICRFHILSDYVLCETEKSDGHDEILNMQEANKCIKAIIEFYDRAHEHGEYNLLNHEAEFKGYFLLLQLQAPCVNYLQINRFLSNWIRVSKSPELRLATTIVEAFRRRFVTSIFSIFASSETDIFVVFLLHSMLFKLWKISFEILVTSSAKSHLLSVISLMQKFCIEDLPHLIDITNCLSLKCSFTEHKKFVSFESIMCSSLLLARRRKSKLVSKAMARFINRHEIIKNNISRQLGIKNKTVAVAAEPTINLDQIRKVQSSIPPKPIRKRKIVPLVVQRKRLKDGTSKPSTQQKVNNLQDITQNNSCRTVRIKAVRKVEVPTSRYNFYRYQTISIPSNKAVLCALFYTRILQFRYLKNLKKQNKTRRLNLTKPRLRKKGISFLQNLLQSYVNSKRWCNFQKLESVSVLLLGSDPVHVGDKGTSYYIESKSQKRINFEIGNSFKTRKDFNAIFCIVSRSEYNHLYILKQLCSSCWHERVPVQVVLITPEDFKGNKATCIEKYMSGVACSSIVFSSMLNFKTNVINSLDFLVQNALQRKSLVFTVEEYFEVCISSKIQPGLKLHDFVQPLTYILCVFDEYSERRNSAIDILIQEENSSCLDMESDILKMKEGKIFSCLMSCFYFPRILKDKGKIMLYEVLDKLVALAPEGSFDNIDLTSETAWNQRKLFMFLQYCISIFNERCRIRIIQSALDVNIVKFSNLTSFHRLLEKKYLTKANTRNIKRRIEMFI